TVDQMIQAARSCKQNIAEGSSAAATSIETEIRLTNVARATLDELKEDYLDYLKSHNFLAWSSTDGKNLAAREFAKEHSAWEEWKPIFDSRPADIFCNLMLVLISQARYLLAQMLKWQEKNFKEHGGVHERMHAARTEARADSWEKTIYSMLDLAEDSADLNARLSQIMAQARKAAVSIARRKRWHVPG
ncbi:MAG: four helix bundle suffix domain-containing protein, partial [Kiritimatiellae bacterium]|nr:four helix bundle suffix domain-containing protein [Kiritimatiellia bacterium]